MHELGYIYVRTHPSYDEHDVCKLGKTSNIPERDSQYVTGEVIRGFFSIVLEISKINMDNIEKLLQSKFESLNIKFNAGIEFYKKDIVALIEPFLQEEEIKYCKLNNNEINSLLRQEKDEKQTKHFENNDEYLPIVPNNEELINYEPRDDQEQIIKESSLYFEKHHKGLLVLPCGVGKTLISLWIAHRLHCKKIIIGVPNTLLLKQWKSNVQKIFTTLPCLLVFSGINEENIESFISSILHKKSTSSISSSSFITFCNK